MATNLGTLTLNLLANTGSYTQGLQRAERQTRQSTEAMARDYNLVGKTIGELKNTIVGYMTGILSVGTAIAKMDTYTGLQNRIKLVTTSQAELNQAMQDTFAIAQASGQSWDSTAQVYQRFADNAKRLGITLGQTASLTDTVTKAIAISGGSAASAEAALVQFGQALASNVLRGEEFNSISEQAPALLKAIATGLGVNIGELRKMAGEGQLTADVVIKSLENAKGSVDDLFGKTDFTIGQSFTQLNNALTLFVGEASKGTGASQLISRSLSELAENLDLVTNAAMVGVAYYAGSYIPAIYASVAAGYAKTKQLVAQSVSQYQAIQVERVAAAQALASAQATVVNTQSTLAALAAEKALEVERLKAQINQAGRIATTTRMAQLRRIETQVTAELTAAETALAAARTRANAAGTVTTRIGGGLLGVLGGPLGLGLTVAGVAASYLLMQDNADKVNKKLEEQASVADRTASELNKLTGVDRKSAINDLTAAFTAQNAELRKSEMAVGSALIDIQNYAKGNMEVTRISNEARLGTISYTEAVKQLNNLSISTDLYNALKDQVAKYDENYTKANKSAEALKVYGKETVIAGNNAQNASVQHQSQANALSDTASAANKASEALENYRNKQKESVFENLYKSGLLDKGYNSAQAQAIYDAQMAKGDSAILSKADVDSALNTLKIQEQYKAQEEAEKRAEEASKKRQAARDKARNDAERLREDQAKSRDSISYNYADEFKKFNIEYQKAVQEINKANFGPEQNYYLGLAKAKYDFEEDMYLRQITEEINAHKWSEDEKLSYYYATQRQIVAESGKFNDELKQLKLESLKEQEQKELAWLKLEQAQRISNAGESLRTELQNLEIRYGFERQQIQENSKLSADERQRRLALSYASEDFQKQQNLNSATAAWGGTFADLNGTGAQYQMEQDKFNKYDQSQALFDAQMALADSAAEREAIWQAHNDRMLLIDQDYEKSKIALGTQSASQTLSGMADLMGALLGEQSAGYKAMFAMSKAFAIAQAIINAPKTFSDVYASVAAIPYIGPYLAPVMAGAAVAVQLAQVAQIKATNMQGFATGGPIVGKGTGTSDSIPIWASNGEFMLNAAAVAKLGMANVDYMNRTGMLPPRFATGGMIGKERFLSTGSQRNGDGVTVNINVPAGYTAVETRNANGEVTVDIVEKMVKQSWSNLNQANSFESKQMRNNIAAGRVR